MRVHRAGLLLAAAGVVLTGCGGGETQADPGDAALEFFEAVADGDAERACDVMLGDDQQPLKEDAELHDECVTQFGEAIVSDEEFRANFEGVTRDDVEVREDGDTAAAAIKDGDYSVPLVKVDGDWYVHLT